jgi:hypothetical protein
MENRIFARAVGFGSLAVLRRSELVLMSMANAVSSAGIKDDKTDSCQIGSKKAYDGSPLTHFYRTSIEFSLKPLSIKSCLTDSR